MKNDYIATLYRAKDIIGSFREIGEICRVSGRAVQKWAKKGRPPRTEYTGETHYAVLISKATQGRVKAHELIPKKKLE